jgi:hypothetical protein
MLSDATAKGGDLYTVNVAGITKQSWTVTTTVAFRDFTDEVSNFFRWGDTTSLWVTISIDGGAYRSTTFSTSDIVVSGEEIQDIALSADKAIIFYTTTIKYLKHVADGTINEVFTKSAITSGNMDLTKSEYQYKIGFSCICNVIKRFACFSSTLNCLIVKKGSSACAGTNLFTYSGR